MWRITVSLASLLGALFGAHLCFAQLTLTNIGGGDFAGAGGTPVSFDAAGAWSSVTDATTMDYTGLTTAAGAKVILAFNSPSSTAQTVSSVVWDPAGANQTFTSLATQSLRSGTQIRAWYLLNPGSSGNKIIRFSESSTVGIVTSLAATSFIGATAVTVGASCGQGTTDPTIQNTKTTSASTSANHMGVIFQRGDITNSNSATWTTNDASSNTGGAARPAYFHGTGSFSLQITFDGANQDIVAWICSDIAP